MIFCNKCGNKLEPDQQFCNKCGNKLEPDQQFCNKCGNKLEPDQQFCNKCGNKLELDQQFCNKCGNKLEPNQQFCNKCGNNMEPQPNKRKFNNKKLITIILITIIVLGSSICGYKKYKSKHISRTIMVYMVGANLESSNGIATNDLNGLDFNKMDKNVNVVAIAGGSKIWHNNYISRDEASIYQYTKDGWKRVHQQPKSNMGTVDVFRNYLDYVYDNYKTDRYDLIFWNHGGAIDGAEYDELFFSDNNLSLSKMTKGISSSKFKNRKFEIIMFRTCLNGTLEVANTFKPFANYLVASEEVTYGLSSVLSMLDFINQIRPDTQSIDLAKSFINNYDTTLSQMKKNDSDNIYEAYSVMDLNKLPQLNKNLESFVKDISVNNNYNLISRVRSNLFQYGLDSKEYNMIDLYNFIDNIKSISPQKADKVLSSINDVVVYKKTSDNQSMGISIYFPYNGANAYKKRFIYILKELNYLPNYNKFIVDYYNTSLTSNKYLELYNDNRSNVTINKDKSISMVLKDTDNYAKSNYLVLKKINNNYELIYEGSAKLDKNTISAKPNYKEYKVKGNTISLIEADNNNIRINIKLSKANEKSIDATLTLNLKDIKLDNSMIVKKEEGLPSTIVLNKNDYQSIYFNTLKVPNYDKLKSDGFKDNYKNYNTNNIQIESFDYDKSEYYTLFKIYDVNNKEYYSNLTRIK